MNDVSWSESNDNILWTVSSDGLIQVWDLNSYLHSDDPLSEFEPSPDPVQVIKGHSSSISSIDWSKNQSDTSSVLTSSCDTTIKLWDSLTGSLVNTFLFDSNVDSCPTCISHQCESIPPLTTALCSPALYSPLPKTPCSLHEVTQVKWSSLKPSTFASTTSDGSLKIYTTKESSVKSPRLEFKPVNDPSSEICSLTTCDWSKYDENLIVVGTSSGILIGLDIRSLKGDLPLFTVKGHRKSVEKITCDLHNSSWFSSISLDSSVKIWDYSALNCSSDSNSMDTTSSQYLIPDTPSVNNHPQLDLFTSFDHHSDQVTGFSYNSSIKDQIVDCSKESLVYLYSIGNSRKPSTSSLTISSSSSLDSVRASFDT